MEKSIHIYETYFSVPDFAKEKNVSTAAIYKAINSNRIKVIYVGKSKTVFISPAYLTSYNPRK